MVLLVNRARDTKENSPETSMRLRRRKEIMADLPVLSTSSLWRKTLDEASF